MGLSALALLAALAAAAAAAPAKAPVAEQAQDSPPRAAAELVAQPAEARPADVKPADVKPAEPGTVPRDPAGTIVADPPPGDPAPPPAGPADPATPSGQAGGAPPAPPAAQAGPAAAPAAPATAPSPPPEALARPSNAADAPPAGPGFSAALDQPPSVVADASAGPDDAGRGAPPVLRWMALALLPLAAAGAYWTMRRRRLRLAARTRSMLALQPRLDRPAAVQPPPRLAFAGPPAAIRARLEPGASRTWTE